MCVDLPGHIISVNLFVTFPDLMALEPMTAVRMAAVASAGAMLAVVFPSLDT